MERLVVQILACDYEVYKLMLQHGRISGRFAADQLNLVNNRLDLGRDILMEPEYQASKEVIVPFSKVVAQENNRSSITSAQAAGRASGLGQASGSGLAIAGDGELISALATATDIVSSVANTLANSLVRRQRGRRQPQQQVSPKPVKKTRKRKAVEDVRGGDLGPRKLRSRK
jgi:hypothetical protein